MNFKRAHKAVLKLQNKEKARILERFFKTGPGEYGEGDIFLGITVPEIRKLSREYKNISLQEVKTLLTSSFHEERLLAILILILQYQQGTEKEKNNIYHIYIEQRKYINNWDLVDLSAQHIVGAHLIDKDKAPIYKLVKSHVLWDRRISILATFCFIKKNKFNDTIKLAKILLQDKEDLIHKAVGWMLREIGKRDLKAEEMFLQRNYKHMPRTMLRYAIERFTERKRQAYLKGTI